MEMRVYNLKPGTRDELHRLMLEQAYPMLKRWKVDVVAFGPSLDDENAYYLLRAYADVADLRQSQDAFYGSDEWKQGPREPVLALIESYASAVMEVDETTLRGLRRLPMAG
jgi:hypothetical protein